jgi:hypothetical protein
MLLPIPPVALDAAWYDAIPTRIARRTFDGRPAAPDLVEGLRTHCEAFRPVPGVRVEFVESAPGDLFTGYAGSYGKIRGAAAAAAFIGPEGAEAAVGYVGEAFILEATRLGLDTCWVAGSFDRTRTAAAFPVGEAERIMSITPVGYAVVKQPVGERAMRRIVHASARKPLSVLARGADGGSWPAWAAMAARAARLAPTGGNGQPQRLRFEEGTLVVGSAAKTYWTAPIDLGIVMLHAELGALRAGMRGRWEQVDAPDTARFVPAP